MAATAARAAQRGLQAFQIFTSNQRRWRGTPIPPEEAAEFRRLVRVPVLSHASYLINPAGGRPNVSQKSRCALLDELARMRQLGIRQMVLHPGSHLGDGPARGIDRAAAMLGSVLEQTDNDDAVILLENTAGMGSSLGADLRQLAAVAGMVGSPDRIGFCIDTAHLHGAGYDLRPQRLPSTVERMLEELGGTVGAFHLNDSAVEAGSRLDRHQSAGEGEIGLEPLAILASMEEFAEVPAVVETPGEDDDRERDARRIVECSETLHSTITKRF
jgi:deoxyribonuclease-4